MTSRDRTSRPPSEGKSASLSADTQPRRRTAGWARWLFAPLALTLVFAFVAFEAAAQTKQLTIKLGNSIPGARVVTSPAGIDCTSGTSAGYTVCSADFDRESTVAITYISDTSRAEILAEFGTEAGGGGTSLGYRQSTSIAFKVNHNLYWDWTVVIRPIVLLTIPLTISGTGTGQVVSDLEGLNCTSSCTARVRAVPPVGPTVERAQWVKLTATPDPGSVFAGWSGACTDNSSVAPTQGNVGSTHWIQFYNFAGSQGVTTCTSRFDVAPRLTVATSGNGAGLVTGPSGLFCRSGSSANCSQTLSSGGSASLTATPDAGSIFAGWSGACSGTSATTSVAMTGDQTCTATFSTPARLTIAMGGTGVGTVTGSSGGLSCSSGSCTVEYVPNTTVMLTATPAAGSTFQSWGGSCSGASPIVNVTVSSDHTCTVNFNSEQKRLTVTLAGTGRGQVSSVPTKISCSDAATSVCSGTFDTGSVVTLTAVATMTSGSSGGSSFTGWSGACTGSAATVTVTMSVAQTCTASFGSVTVPQTGTWWNASEGGRGYGIEVQYLDGAPRIFFGAFVYAASGPPVWYTSLLTRSSDGTGFDGPLMAYAGGQTLLGTYQAPTTSQTVGLGGQQLRLSFSSATEGTIEFPALQAFSAGTTVAITRFPIVSGGLSNPRATTLPETGWWWNAAEGGRGIFLESQADSAGNHTLFALFFLYGSDGSARWYFGSVSLAPGLTGWSALAMALSECSGGQPIGATTPELADCVAVPGGQTTIQFAAGGISATMMLSNGVSVPLTRFSF